MAKTAKKGTGKNREGSGSALVSAAINQNSVEKLGVIPWRFSGADLTYRSADDKNLLYIIELVRSGINPNAFGELTELTPFTMAEWADFLQLSERTIQRNQKEKKAFQPIQSEKIVELAMLYNYGVEVFGDKDNFDIWLDAKSIALGGRKPKELLDTNFGINLVKDELGRIEHGILA